MSEPHIGGEYRDEKETVFNRIWKNDDLLYVRYRLRRHRQKDRRKKLKHTHCKPDHIEEKMSLPGEFDTRGKGHRNRIYPDIAHLNGENPV